jgi:hypothetical protein
LNDFRLADARNLKQISQQQLAAALRGEKGIFMPLKQSLQQRHAANSTGSTSFPYARAFLTPHGSPPLSSTR